MSQTQRLVTQNNNVTQATCHVTTITTIQPTQSQVLLAGTNSNVDSIQYSQSQILPTDTNTTCDQITQNNVTQVHFTNSTTIAQGSQDSQSQDMLTDTIIGGQPTQVNGIEELLSNSSMSQSTSSQSTNSQSDNTNPDNDLEEEVNDNVHDIENNNQEEIIAGYEHSNENTERMNSYILQKQALIGETILVGKGSKKIIWKVIPDVEGRQGNEIFNNDQVGIRGFNFQQRGPSQVQNGDRLNLLSLFFICGQVIGKIS